MLRRGRKLGRSQHIRGRNVDRATAASLSASALATAVPSANPTAFPTAFAATPEPPAKPVCTGASV